MKRCENSRRHKAPFFTLEPRRLCGECLKAGEVRAAGKDLMPCATKE